MAGPVYNRQTQLREVWQVGMEHFLELSSDGRVWQQETRKKKLETKNKKQKTKNNCRGLLTLKMYNTLPGDRHGSWSSTQVGFDSTANPCACKKIKKTKPYLPLLSLLPTPKNEGTWSKNKNKAS